MKYDVAIIGAGPAGIFTALEMIKKGSKKNRLCQLSHLTLEGGGKSACMG